MPVANMSQIPVVYKNDIIDFCYSVSKALKHKRDNKHIMITMYI